MRGNITFTDTGPATYFVEGDGFLKKQSRKASRRSPAMATIAKKVTADSFIIL